MVDDTVRRGGGWTKQGNWAAGGSVDRDNDDIHDDEGGGGHRNDRDNDNDHDEEGG